MPAKKVQVKFSFFYFFLAFLIEGPFYYYLKHQTTSRLMRAGITMSRVQRSKGAACSSSASRGAKRHCLCPGTPLPFPGKSTDEYSPPFWVGFIYTLIQIPGSTISWVWEDRCGPRKPGRLSYRHPGKSSSQAHGKS